MQAAYTFANAVAGAWQDLINELNDDFSTDFDDWYTGCRHEEGWPALSEVDEDSDEEIERKQKAVEQWLSNWISEK